MVMIVYLIQLTASTCMFADIVLNINSMRHIPHALKLHQQNDSDFAYRFQKLSI